MSLENQLARYKALLSTARCFGKSMDLPTLIDEILNRSQEVMRAEACTLFLPDAQTGELILHSTDPKIASLPQPLRLPPRKGIAGEVFQTGQRVNIPDAQNDPRFYRKIGQQVGFVTRAMLTVPLVDDAECVGVLQALNPRDRPAFDEHDEEIFEGFGGLIANALVRLASERQQLELARSKQELQVAREIQESFLPPASQPFPFGRVDMNYFPASAVGGDFCCVHAVGPNRLLLGLGDVTGKGIPAALTMARATAMIKARVDQIQTDLGEWVSALNEQLVQDLQAGRFIGMTFMLADAAASTLQVCAAGQFPPLHYDGREWHSFPLRSHMPLGIAPGLRFQAETTALKPGDAWLLYSDGIPEARNRTGEDFTVQSFLQSLPARAGLDLSLDSAVAAWKEFVNSASQHDDASLLLLEWRGEAIKPPRPAPPASLRLVCCLENFGQGRDFVEKWAEFAGYDDETVGRIILACDEAATNVFRHGYRCNPGPLAYRAEVADGHLTIRIEDEAEPADPCSFKGRELVDLRPGGLGTFIMANIFDEVNYEPKPNGTCLTLRKKLPANVAGGS